MNLIQLDKLSMIIIPLQACPELRGFPANRKFWANLEELVTQQTGIGIGPTPVAELEFEPNFKFGFCPVCTQHPSS